MTLTERLTPRYEPETMVKVGGRVVDVTLMTGDFYASESLGDQVLLMAPGFVAKRRCYRSLAREMANRGYPTLLMAHRGNRVEHSVEDVLAVVDAAYAGAIDGLTAPRQLHVMGHSYGTIDAVLAALQNERDINSVIPLAPAGFGGVSARKAPQSIIHELRHMRPEEWVIAREAVEFVQHAGIATVWFARHAMIRSLAQEASALHETGRMPGAVIYAHDELINPKVSTMALHEVGIPVRTVDSVYAGHNAHIYAPAEVADAIESALETTSS